MLKKYLFLLFLAQLTCLCAQDISKVTGAVYNGIDKTPLTGVVIAIEGERISCQTNKSGNFQLITPLKGDYILTVTYPDFLVKRVPLSLENKTLDMGIIYLERDINIEKNDNLITLSDDELSDDGSSSSALGLLQSTRDVFLNRAAFDFSQAFFRIRGYDAQNGEVLLNGLPMNKFFDGRPQWNNWGGLNDVVRNQEFSNGLSPSEYTFGGISGNTNIDLRPAGLRPGVRISSSVSNRTYAGRIMATYNSGLQKNGLAYMLSASRRWAKEGYIEGTLYDAYSIYGALQYQPNKKNGLLLTAFLASNRRGRSSAITEEVYDLVGSGYNPYWGSQDGRIRNTRERKIAEPVIMLNYFYDSAKFDLQFGMAFQTGRTARSRLGYYNAPNPDPTYYRYLPSFYINSPIGANFVSAAIARTGFLNDPQLNWENVYRANTAGSQNGKAAYILYDDTADNSRFTTKVNGNYKLNNKFKIDFGLGHTTLKSDNYAQINDLLGADFHEDIDPFSNTRNDLITDTRKENGDVFNYNYELSANKTDAFIQLNLDFNRWKGFLSGQFSTIEYLRNGLFENERFFENSLGQSEEISFSDFGIKGGLTHKLTGRHWITSNTAYVKRAPVLQNVFVNPRESNTIVPDLRSETISTVDVSYFLRMPRLTGRLTGFYTRFQNTTDINFFFVDSGVGSDFVQEVLTDLDKLHMGVEFGMEYELSASVKLSGVAAIGKYLYASNPLVTINFDTAGVDEELIDVSGSKDLGPASIKDYKLAQGPQKAFSIGMEYRDPKYWWVGMTANYLANNYAHISTITRTNSFLLDPDTGERFRDANEENVAALLAQAPLDNFYVLNLTGGKSWLKKGKYLGIFLSVNNVFDAVFRTGGYEQSRNGNFGQLRQDNLSGSPSFAPKYWYGYGRTYFLNIAFSF
ncbi:carboxypeptidase-like regulatory domain-containing protein [Maribacter sp. 2304DJ31-5]|uniref:carboxypeptidase-like regulatory domain-containing protein n=1 Tax=Maribacter sp. 2304DJ31-5 TaxID=3386273 RepID=UPI0039BD232D